MNSTSPKNADNSVRSALLAYPLMLYSASFLGFIAYHFFRDPFWFQSAYAAGIGGLIMTIITSSAEMIDSRFRTATISDEKGKNIAPKVFKLFAFLFFSSTALMLRNEFERLQPNDFNALWLTGIGLISFIYSENEFLSHLLKSNSRKSADENKSLASETKSLSR